MKIEDYALIGDSHTTALVGRTGSIDWLCLPRFDSPACFAALLGAESNGHWRIAPALPVIAVERRYQRDSWVLETDFETATGRIRLTDYMPPRRSQAWVIREIRCLEGTALMQLELSVGFGNGLIRPWIQGTKRSVSFQAQGDLLTLYSPIRIQVSGSTARATTTLRAGNTRRFALQWQPAHLAHELPEPIRSARARSLAWSRRSLAAGDYQGPYRDSVRRSLLVLKALTYAPTGSLAAAATASLPEVLGGTLNWDYRFCWLRDAAFALDALIAAGFAEPSSKWLGGLLRAVAGDPKQLQTAYTVSAGRDLPEQILGGLAGYEGSRPVRIGNAAALQFQLDVYGEVVNALHLARQAGLMIRESTIESWALQTGLLEHVESCWMRNDHGIWEERGRPRPFTYSKVMAWVAADRTVKAIETHGLCGDSARWRRLRKAIHEDVLLHGYNRRLKAFTQCYDSDAIDASLLRLPMVGFISARDPRMRSTVRQIERQLVEGGIVARRHSRRAHPQGAFLPCSFWLASNYALAGRRGDARRLFERVLSLGNDVGLFAEEYDLKQRRFAGNFPQAMTHSALIQCAVLLGGRAAAGRAATSRKP